MDRLYLETKIMADGDDGSIAGIAWPFKAGDRLNDWIEPGAFKGTKLPIPLLFAHDQAEPLGVWSEAVEAADGLHLKGRLLVDDVARAREVRALVRSGAVRGISIGFLTKKAIPRTGGGRTIQSVELLEASLVVLPMHPGARVTSAKSLASALALVAAIERATAQLTEGNR